MSEPESAARRAEQALTVIERVVQIRWALLVVSFVLAADSALGLFWHQSLLSFQPHAGDGRAAIPVGAYVLFAGGYVFTMAGLLPLIQRCIAPAIWWLRFSTVGSWLGKDHKIERQKDKFRDGYVRVYDAMDEALINRDAFWGARIEALEAERKRAEADESVLAQISFACTLLLILNYAIAAPGTISLLFATWLGAQSGILHLAGVLLAVAALILLAGPWWFTVWMGANWHSRWIYHPDLARRKLATLRQQEIDNQVP